MPKMIRPRYLVALADRDEPVEVTVLHVDQLVGEEHARRIGAPVDPSEAPQLHTTLYVFAALRRMGAEPGEWRRFRDELLIGMEGIRTPLPVAVPDGEPVDPTPAGRLTDSL